MGNVLGNVDWSFGTGDIWSTSMIVVGSLSGFLILGLAVKFAPDLFVLIRDAIFGEKRIYSDTVYSDYMGTGREYFVKGKGYFSDTELRPKRQGFRDSRRERAYYKEHGRAIEYTRDVYEKRGVKFN